MLEALHHLISNDKYLLQEVFVLAFWAVVPALTCIHWLEVRAGRAKPIELDADAAERIPGDW